MSYKQPTNRELLRFHNDRLHGSLLTGLEKQHQFLLRRALDKMPCPACGFLSSQIDAAGIDIDEYKFDLTQYNYHCPNCHVGLEHNLLLFGGQTVWTIRKNKIVA